jgi:hypothetical protein
MKIKIQNSRDFYAGLVFVFFGILAAAGSRNFPLGTAARMGPGYFPYLVGWVLTLLGLAIGVRALWLSGESVKKWALRPLLMVLGSVFAFAFLVNTLGLVLAILALVVISCLGGGEFRTLEVGILFLLLAALSVGLFVWGLGLPFALWPG